MAYARVHSCTIAGIAALPVVIEVQTTGGLPCTAIVGLPQSSVRESRDRVKAALQHAGFRYPQSRVIINLAPADLPKQGGRFDLPIALGILVASGQLDEAGSEHCVVVGELGLTGEVRPVRGALPAALWLADGHRALLLPQVNAPEAARCARTCLHPVGSLKEACRAFTPAYRRTGTMATLGGTGSAASSASSAADCATIEPDAPDAADAPDAPDAPHPADSADSAEQVVPTVTASAWQGPDLSDLLGQSMARRALEIAAAGGHNMLLAGPPGTGKSMLASRLPGILPAMTESEAVAVASVASISHQGFQDATWGVRPFRAPHHSASSVALVGGGSPPMPGEASLAHHGVLFLDELPEFARPVLDALRQPMENGCLTVSRAARQAEFPAAFQLVAAMNPCPCGYHGDIAHHCRCSPDTIARYQSRVSGPFLDRIDLHVHMSRLSADERNHVGSRPGESSKRVRDRVQAARDRQLQRQGTPNAQLDTVGLNQHCLLEAEARQLLVQAVERLHLSMRVSDRLRRVARTIADLRAADTIEPSHLVEALSYRDLSRGDAIPASLS